MLSGTTITGLIITIICIIPLVLMSVSRRRKKQRIINSLKELAKQDNKTFSQFDLWKENAISISEGKDNIYAIRKMQDSVLEYSINLNEIKSCKIVNRSKIAKFEGGNTTLIELLALVFSYKENSKSDLIIDFYNTGYDNVALADELILIQKWEKIINSCIIELSKTK